nr:sialidase-4 isoform X3 [Dromaius novaehollandiae]
MGSRHFPARTVLFEKESNGVTYRVPALLYLPCMAKLLAFAEERLSADDAHANLLVLRRGTIYRNYVEWEDMRVLETATLKQHRSMNPCPVYDEFTGTLFLFFITVLGKTPEAYQIITGQNVTRLCYVTSSDQGLSWSKVTDLTQQVIGRAIKDWATFALGPGHGIQLRSGRLLVPAYSYHIDCKECFGKLCKTTPHSFTFYSDDHGRSWRFGEFIPNLQTASLRGLGRLLLSRKFSRFHYLPAWEAAGGAIPTTALSSQPAASQMRAGSKEVCPSGGHHGDAHDVTFFSHDAGQRDPKMTSKPSVFFQTPTWVLYSHPTSSMSRVNMGIHLSTFPRDAESWTEPWVIYEGPSAYSDLAYIKLSYSEYSASGTPAIAFACLYENGTRSPYEQISFSMFTLHDVLQNIPLTSTPLGREDVPLSRAKRKRRSCLVS